MMTSESLALNETKENTSDSPTLVAVPGPESFEEIFKASCYRINQPFVQVRKEVYRIDSPENEEMYYAQRDRMLFRKLVNFFASFFVFAGTWLGSIFLATFYAESVEPVILVSFVWGGFFAGIVVSIILRRFIAPKRATTLFAGTEENKTNFPLFVAKPTSGFFLFNREFSLIDPKGNEVIKLKRPFFYSLYRTRWDAYDEKGELLFRAQEDSVFKGFLRRYFKLGFLISLNFHFKSADGKNFGSYIRKFSVKDKYKLEFDREVVKPWLIVGTCLLLDTGEKR